MADPFKEREFHVSVNFKREGHASFRAKESATVKLMDAFHTRDTSAPSYTWVVETNDGVSIIDLMDVNLIHASVGSPEAKKELLEALSIV